MRKGWILLLAAALLMCAVPGADAEEELPLSARCAVLTGPEGQILYERNAHARCPIASTTKLMTALVTAERCSGEEIVEIPAVCCGVEGTSMYLQPGERYTVTELLEGLLLASGNDAALALARHCAGSEEDFVARMNETAARLGLTDSHFMNPHGLNAEGHYGSAADLARLLAACMERPELAAILAKPAAEIHGTSYVNHNKLLLRCPGCLGGKTGYTQAAGRCLVSCCERKGTRLYCVTLDDPDDWQDQETLYDWGFARYATRDAAAGLRYSVPLLSDGGGEVLLRADPLVVFFPLDAELSVRAELPRFIFGPVSAGEIGGRVTVYADGAELGSAALRFAESRPSADGERS